MALIPPPFVDSVVAIGVDAPNGERRWIASGFLYGYLRESSGETRTYKTYLVTNRHVVQSQSCIWLRFNPQGTAPAREYRLGDLQKNLFCPTDEMDVAVVPIDYQRLEKDGMRVHFFQSDQNVSDIKAMRDLGVTEGDFVYVLGFPMGLVGEQRNTVLVRSGSIARIRDTLADENHSFLLDVFVFPGNSGGPVILKPELVSIGGTKPQKSARLIGIVSGYVPYKDVAVSPQTGRVRVVFE